MKRYIRAIIKSFIDFFRGGGFMLAGSLSFFSVMAIIPFCLLLAALFGYILGENAGFYRFLASKLIDLFPKVTQRITDELSSLIAYRGLGGFSLILYGLLSLQMFSSLESSLNSIFMVKKKRHLLSSILLSFVIITIIMVFIFISFSATSFVLMLRGYLPVLGIGKAYSFIISFIIPFVLIALTATVLYKILPKKRIRLRDALFGAVFASVFLEVAKHLFTFYILKIVKLGSVYGSLSAFMIFLLWVYYSSCIFLIGAGFIKNLGGANDRSYRQNR